MVPFGSSTSCAAGKLMKPPRWAGQGPGLTLTTGSRHEKSTPVTGTSPAAVGMGEGEEAVTAAVGLTAAAGCDSLHATSKIPARQRTLIGVLTVQTTVRFFLPTDSDQDRVTKEVFVIISFGVSLAGVVWALMYLALGKPWSALVPLCITIATVPTLARFAATKRLGLLPVPMLGLGILLPLLLQLSLGGYLHGSAVVMWAFMAPLFSLLLRPARETWIWLFAFLADLAVAAILDATVMNT